MKLLVVTEASPWVRSVSTVQHYAAAGRALGHDVAVYGEPNPDLPNLPFTTDLSGVDLALFILQVPSDLPDMPYLARILDSVPRERRSVVDLWGRYNDTIRLDHDFNHLEKLDGHLGWEWDEAIKAISGTILQPTLKPLRPDAGSFLFHAFDPGSVVRPYASAKDAAAAWRDPDAKPYGVMYVGSNWQRWAGMRSFLEGYEPVRKEVGTACLVGWDWWERPSWAAEKGIMGVDADPEFLTRNEAEVRNGVRFDEVVELLGQGRFTPVLHRPLFRHLGYPTVRSFETFHADTIPVLMLPRDFVQSVYGEAALTLVPDGDVGALLTDALAKPEKYWDAVLQTREHLARHHSYAKRFEQLNALVKARGGARGAS